ncbi:MAG: hypothetical protein HOW97_38820, partial [Catenulispora sp.]|nr:hypothetical protein [Catenulispora sp.]
MGNVLDPVGAAASLFDKRLDLRLLVVPRRDGAALGPGAAATEPPLTHPDAAAAFEGLLAAARPTLDTALRHGTAGADLVEAGSRPELGDPVLRTPRQAAIAAAAILFDAPRGLEAEGIADAWAAARGLPFAAQAAVELAGFAVCTLHTSNDTPALRHTDRGHFYVHQNERFAIAARVRRHLVTASDADHAATYEAVEAMSGLNGEQSAAAVFLFPERTRRFDRELKGLHGAPTAGRSLSVWFLLGAVTTGDQALELAHTVWTDGLRQSAAATATAFATVGTDLVPALAHWIDETWDPEEKLRLQRVLTGLDCDEAFRVQLGMLDTRGAVAVVLDAAARFPERGVRLLAEEQPVPPALRAAVERLLRLHVTAWPEVAREVLPALGADAAARVEKLLSTTVKVPAADPATLPAVLVSPPWQQERRAVKPAVVNGLTAVPENAVVWLDDAEREQWRADTLGHRGGDEQDWARLLREVRNRRRWYTVGLLIVRGPEEAARTALGLADEGHTWDALEWLKPAVARFGAEALPAVLNAVRADAALNAPAVLPFASTEVALLAADWKARLKTVRPVARAWLRRH